MRAEDTLQFMMDFYGDLYYDRQKCLDQLFCVVGNGYEWIDGELVEFENDTNNFLQRWKLIRPITHAEPDEFTLQNGKIQEDRYRSNGLEISKWYPLSKKYSYLFNYPDDIKPDWKALLEECKQMLIEDGIDIENVPE